MQLLQNKAALIICVLGLSLGLSWAKIYQQHQKIQILESQPEPFPHFDYQGHIQFDVPDINLEIMEVPVPDIELHEADLERATELMKEEMARLQEEYERMLYEHQSLINEHVEKAKKGRAE